MRGFMAILECRVRKNRFECSSQTDLSNKPIGGSGMAHAHWFFCFKSSFYKVLFGLGLDTFGFFSTPVQLFFVAYISRY